MASSPVVIGETVIVQIESQGDSFAAGFDTASGASRWQIARPRRGEIEPRPLPSAAAVQDKFILIQWSFNTPGRRLRRPKRSRGVERG